MMQNLYKRISGFLKTKAPDSTGSGQKKSQKMLEDRMAAIELAGDGIAIVEGDGRLSFANHAFVEIYGYKSWHDLIRRDWMGLFSEDMRHILKNDVLCALNVGGRWHSTGLGIKKDGSEFSKSVSLSFLPGNRWIVVVRDVSESLKAEALSRQRLAAIEVAGDGIGITDPQGNLVYMNNALKMLHELDEYEAQDQIKKPWTALYTDAGRTQIDKEVIPALKKDGQWKGESPILTKSGRIVYAEMSLTALPEGGMIGTARDITERIHAEQERMELEKKFHQAQKMEAVGRLAGGIAHDFNNILAAMMGYAEFLIEDLPEGSQMQKYAQSIYSGGAQASDVVSRLLMFSRTQEHKFEMLDMGRKVSETISILRSSIPSTIQINFEPADFPLLINGNKTLISQAVMNLCVNASDAIGDHHGIITLKVYKDTYSGLGSEYIVHGNIEKNIEICAVSVSDNGCGMDSKTMEKMFDPFFTTKAVDQGTGLGLSSVHGVMAAHKGAVAVRSTAGFGTEFILLFPYPQNAFVTQPFERAVLHPLVGKNKNINILVVDDQPDVRHMVFDLLKRMGQSPEICVDGFSAIEALRKKPGHFQMVITDQTMPGMTGCELADKIDKEFKDISVVLMSGYSTDDISVLTKGKKNIISILQKPINQDDVLRAISRVSVQQEYDSAV